MKFILKMTKKQTKISKDNKGSALVLVVLVMVNALIIAMAITVISVMEKKSASKVKRSTPALQAADSGLEWAMSKIENSNPGDTISDVFGSDCNAGVVSYQNSEIYFISELLNFETGDFTSEIGDCSTPINDISRIRSKGVNAIAGADDVVERSIDAIAATKCQRGFQPVADFCIQSDDYFGSNEVRPGGGWKGSVIRNGAAGDDIWSPGAAEACAKIGARLCSISERVAALCADDPVEIIEADPNRVVSMGAGSEVEEYEEMFDRTGELTADLSAAGRMIVIDVGSTCDDVKFKSVDILKDPDQEEGEGDTRENGLAYRCCMNR